MRNRRDDRRDYKKESRREDRRKDNKKSDDRSRKSSNQKRGLRGRGPTPKAEDRPYHKAAKRSAKPQSKRESGKPERSDRRTRDERGFKPRRDRDFKGRGTHGFKKRGPERRKSDREKTFVDTIAGRNIVLEALRAGIPARELVVASGVDIDDRLTEIMHHAQKLQLTIREVPRGKVEALTGISGHQGVALIVKPFQYSSQKEIFQRAKKPALFVAVDGVTDPRNIGAIVRSAAAFGADGLLIPERRNASVTAVAWKASAGAAARLPIAHVTNLARAIDDAKEYGCFIVGLDGESTETVGAMSLSTEPILVIAGSEGKGLSRLIRDKCDVIVSIPMHHSVESLNASVAMSIALYEIDKKRRNV